MRDPFGPSFRVRDPSDWTGILCELRPSTAFALSLAGGILILFNKMIMMIGGSLLIEFIGMGIVIMVIGAFLGLIVIVGSIVLYSRPALHGAMGMTIVLVSLTSIIIGTIMGSICGILAFVWGSQRGAFLQGDL